MSTISYTAVGRRKEATAKVKLQPGHDNGDHAPFHSPYHVSNQEIHMVSLSGRASGAASEASILVGCLTFRRQDQEIWK